MTTSTILENKKLISSIVDLQSVVLKIDTANVKVDNYVLIEENIEMSIDMIAIAAYGTNDAIDILCKFNKISNPLSIKAGDIIAIPNLNSLFANISKVSVKSMQLSKKQVSPLKTNITSSSSSVPSKKSNPTKNFTKSKDGIIIF